MVPIESTKFKFECPQKCQPTPAQAIEKKMMKATGSVGGVIASYHPDANLPAMVQMLVGAGVSVLVVDDASPSRYDSILDQAVSAGARLRKFGTNAGIGRSLNEGRQWAKNEGFTWLMTLDQDSSFDSDFVDSAIRCFNQAGEAGLKVGLVAPGKINGSRRKPIVEKGNFNTALDVMQSGSLFAVNVLNETGPFREDFVVDCIDTDYCLRLRRADRVLLWNTECNLRHQLGASRPAKLFGREVVVRGRHLYASNHSPLRRYYMARNRLVLLKEYARLDNAWLKYALPAYLRDTLVSITLERSRMQNFVALARGIKDAVIRRTGVRR